MGKLIFGLQFLELPNEVVAGQTDKEVLGTVDRHGSFQVV